MIRTCAAFILAGLLSLAAQSVAAQGSEDVKVLNELVNDAFGKLTDLQESYFDVRSRLADYTQTIKSVLHILVYT